MRRFSEAFTLEHVLASEMTIENADVALINLLCATGLDGAATDGAAGLIKAVEECFPRSARQRCLVHKVRNVQAKVTDEQLWPQVKAEASSAYQAANVETARLLRDGFVGRWRKRFPTAVACFEEDFEACVEHLVFPVTHRRAIRTTNLLERLFEEDRRRTTILLGTDA